MKKSLIKVLVGLVFSMFMAASASAGPVLQLRLADDTASDGAEKMTYASHNAEHTNINVVYVQKAVLLDETMLKSATAGTNALGGAMISLTFTDAGSKRLAEVTRENINKKLAVIINGEIYQVPVIRSEISGGQAQIAGSFSKEEAEDLVKKLNAAMGKSRTSGIEG